MWFIIKHVFRNSPVHSWWGSSEQYICVHQGVSDHLLLNTGTVWEVCVILEVIVLLFEICMKK